jgi:hypothetical protein
MNNILLLGRNGNIGSSLLSFFNKIVLNKDEILYEFLSNITIHTIDVNPPNQSYENLLINNFTFDLRQNTFEIIVTTIKPTLIIDCSDIYWDYIFPIIDGKKISYINTSIEDLQEKKDRASRFIDGKDRWKIKSIMGCGANSGWVQWVCCDTINRQGAEGLKGIYIIEKDTGVVVKPDPKTIYLTWNLNKYLDETLVRPVFFDKGKYSVLLKNSFNYNLPIKVTEDFSFTGILVPHDEAYEISLKYGVESCYIYEINNHSLDLLRSYFKDIYINFTDEDNLEFNSKIRKVIHDEGFDVTHTDKTITGKDMLGILFVYEDRQIAVYEVEDHAECVTKYNINATCFQVICGLYAGICSILFESLEEKPYVVMELVHKEGSHFGHYLNQHLKNWYEVETLDNSINLKKLMLNDEQIPLLT